MNTARLPSAPAGRSWTVLVRDVVSSTNDEARGLPAWHAVRARRQSQGRGRHGRAWTSGEGGLWISAVVPTPGEASAWRCLPLAAGVGVIAAVRRFGVAGARLRWPNDVLVGSCKLAGLLVEQFEPATAVIGLGLNMANRPADEDPALGETAISLSDCAPQIPSLEEAAAVVLESIARAHALLATGGPAALTADLADCWGGERWEVLLTLANGTVVQGQFEGVDAAGDLVLSSTAGGEPRRAFPAHEVLLLREIP